MRRMVLFFAFVFFVSAVLLAQQEPKKEEPAPKEDTKQQQDKIKLFIKIVDYVDGEEHKWRISEFIVKETFLIASIERKEEFIEKRVRKYRKKKKFRNKSEEEVRKAMEKMWEDLRKRRGLTEWDFSHIEVLDLKKVKKMLKQKGKEKPEEEKGKEERERKEGKDDEEEPKDEPKDEPEKPKELTEEDLRKMADYIIEGEVKSVKAKPSVWLGHTVQYNANMEGKIKVIDAKTGEVIKEIESKHKMGAESGQDEAHQRALKSAGLDFAKALINLEVFREGAKREKKEKK